MDLNAFSQHLLEYQFPIAFPGHWIANKWRQFPSAKNIKGSFSPNNNALLVEPASDKAVLDSALDAASEAQVRLLKLKTEERFALIKKMRHALADFEELSVRAMSAEAGKPEWEGRFYFSSAMRFLDNIIASQAHFESSLLGMAKMAANPKNSYAFLPLGPTIAFLPFSTPITSFVTYFAGTILSGCPLILCPSSHAILSGLLFGYLAEKLDLPQGSFSIIFGNFEIFKKSLSDKRLRAIIYTGSREHCELIRRESKSVAGRELILQSGGKNAVLIHSSADIPLAVKCVTQGAFQSSGQLCSSTSRVFVHKSLFSDFCDALSKTVHSLPIGPIKPGKNAMQPFMGPLYAKKAVEKFLRYQTMAHRETQTKLNWGKSMDDPESQCLVQPGIHVLKEFDNSNGYQSNVLFCPDVAIYDYEVLDEAIQKINTTDAPYVVSFIGDGEIIRSRRHQFVAPNLLINLPTVEVESCPNLAGKFHSGNHRLNGAGLAFLLTYPSLVQDTSETHILSAWPWPNN